MMQARLGDTGVGRACAEDGIPLVRLVHRKKWPVLANLPLTVARWTHIFKVGQYFQRKMACFSWNISTPDHYFSLD